MTLVNNPVGETDVDDLKKPIIRPRHSGLGTRRKPIAESTVKPPRRSLWSRLGLARAPKAQDVDFGPTPIKGAAVVPDRTVRPALGANASALAPSFPGEDDDAILTGLFGDTAPQELREAATRAPPRRATSAPRAPVAPPVYLEPTPAPVEKKRRRLDRSDLTLAALGIVLGTTCAVFPWYIFLNQEKFGVRSFVFDSSRGDNPAARAAVQPNAIGKAFANSEVPKLNLDFFPTATLPTNEDEIRAVPSSDQPFPLDLVPFQLVHVANGRAMIEDSDGLWVVQRGSRLPDGSRVVSIEKRNGDWILETTLDAVIKLQR
jgi:hypothetical protein